MRTFHSAIASHNEDYQRQGARARLWDVDKKTTSAQHGTALWIMSRATYERHHGRGPSSLPPTFTVGELRESGLGKSPRVCLRVVGRKTASVQHRIAL